MTVTQTQCISIAGVTGAAAVIFGAFGAHGLENRLSSEMMNVYQTGVLYHLIHSIAILCLACASKPIWSSKWTGRITVAWISGIFLFSGSLYILAISGIKILGAITPFGGIAFIAGWGMVLLVRPIDD